MKDCSQILKDQKAVKIHKRLLTFESLLCYNWEAEKDIRTMNKQEEILTILERARHFLREEKFWAKWTLAQTENGEEVSIDSPFAVRFCMLGAIKRSLFENDNGINSETEWDKNPNFLTIIKEFREPIKKMKPEYRFWNIPYFNNRQNTTHEDVLLVFDEVITNIRSGDQKQEMLLVV